MGQFVRSNAGQRNLDLFFVRPLIWVEGEDDVVYFQHALRDRYAEIKDANGRDNCERLAAEVVELQLPFGVILDGDYGLLECDSVRNTKIVRLPRYSIENFLFDEGIPERVCRNLTGYFGQESFFTTAFREISNTVQHEMREIIELDATCCLTCADDSPLKGRVEKFLVKKDEYYLDQAKLRAAVRRCRAVVEQSSIERIQQSVNVFLEERPLWHLLRGHILFGLLGFALSMSMRKAGYGRAPDDKALRALFAGEMWRAPLAGDHQDVLNRVDAMLTRLSEEIGDRGQV